MFAFLAHKIHLPFFFICTKPGPKVNTISREYDKRVQHSFLFETQGANVKLHNGGSLGLGTGRNVSGISNSLSNNIATARSLVKNSDQNFLPLHLAAPC